MINIIHNIIILFFILLILYVNIIYLKKINLIIFKQKNVKIQ